MVKQQKKCEQDRLTRSILLGLATGTSLLLACGGTASATTLSEYKAQLAANAAVEAGSGEKKLISEADGYKSPGKVIHASAGGQIFIADTPAADVASYENTMTDASAGHWNKKSNAVVDLTNDVFFSEGENSKISIENGTVKVKASNLYGQGETSETIVPSDGDVPGYIRRYGKISTTTPPTEFLNEEFPAGVIEIGDVDEYKSWENETNSGAYGTLKIIGNTKFNNSGWTNEAGNVINNKNFIVLRKNGILEAESAQIFNFGLNDGTAINTGGVRKDANDAILFESGVVLLDDDKYNNEYLNDANLAVKLADDGNTIVEVKNTAQLVDVGAKTGTITNAVGKSDTVLTAGSESGLSTPWNIGDKNILDYVKSNNWNGHPWNSHENSKRHNLVRKIFIEDGSVANPMTITAGFDDGYSGDLYIIHNEKGHIYDSASPFAEYSKDIEQQDTIVDMQNVELKVSPVTGTYKPNGMSGDEAMAAIEKETRNVIEFCNGTTLVKASNLYGDEKNVINISSPYPAGLDSASDGEYRVYGVDGAQIPATLKLVGNEKFNSNWTTDAGDTVNGKNFIVINDKGTLEANSAQIFNFGLGNDGTVATTGGVRKDANDAILFKSGVVLLDDKKYNNAYLTDANIAVKMADKGDTVVEVKSDAEQVNIGTKGLTYGVEIVGATTFPSEGSYKPFDLDDSSVLGYVKENAKWNGRVGVTNDPVPWSYHTYAVENGTKAKPMTLGVGLFNDGYDIASIVHVEDSSKTGAGNEVKTIDSTVDLTDVIFKVIPATGTHKTYYDSKEVDNRNKLSFCNGTTLVKASNLYGDEKNTLEVGESSEYYTGSPDVSPVPATVKLIGNENFNSTWQTDAGDTINGRNFIVINESGTLEANSAQIFTIGLGTDGDIMSPKSIRVDADNAIYFKSGVLLLDDEKYNIDYLNEANKLVKEADGGTTKVEVKPTATKVEGNPNAGTDQEKENTNTGDNSNTNTNTNSDSVIRDIGNVPDDSWFGPVISGKFNIVISGVLGADSTVDKLNAQSLDLAEPPAGTANTITVNGKTFALGSSTEGQELLTIGGKKPALPMVMKIINGGTLRLGTGNAANDVYAEITLGDGTANDNATLNVAAGIKTINSLVANMGSQVLVAAQAMLNSPTVTFNGATVKLDGILNVAGAAVFGQNSVVYVGSAEAAGKMIVSGDISSTAGTAIFLDPVWKDGAEITDASQLAVSDTNIDYNLVVGRNSVASIGTDDTTKAQQAFAETRLNWGEDDTTAALYLAKPVTLDGSIGLTVDGSLSAYAAPSADMATFAADSLLMVDAEALNGEAALTASSGAGTLTVDDTAKLYLANAQAGDSYTLTSGFTTTTNAKGWYNNTDNVMVNKLLKVNSTGSTAVVAKNENSTVLKNCAIPNLVSAVVDKKVLTTKTGTEAYSAGANYVAMATSGLLSDAQSISLLNNAAQAAEVTGATGNALRMATTFAETAQNHLSFMSQTQQAAKTTMQNEDKTVMVGASFADDSKAATPMLELHMSDKDQNIRQVVKGEAGKEITPAKVTEDKGSIWAAAAHEQGRIDGRDLAGNNSAANYDNRFTGITVGYDFAKQGNYEQGIAISYGSGSATANGLNERDKYQGGGVSYYGSIRKGDSNLLLDVGGYQVKHDVKGLLTADSKTNMLTLGITEEYRKPAGNGGVFVPHIGLRYTYMDTPAYDGVYNGKTAFRYAPQKNHVFTVPVGIGYMHTQHSHGWKYNLFADLSYIGVLGGQSASMDVTIPGLNARDSVSYDVVDQSALKATLGLEAENERIKWGVNYSFKGSSNEKTHRVSAGISWKF